MSSRPGAGRGPSPKWWARREPSASRPGDGVTLARFAEPGRPAYELSLAFCALSLVFPWLVVGAVASGARSWRRGSAQAWRALLAAAWCCLLGVALRQYVGLGIFP